MIVTVVVEKHVSQPIATVFSFVDDQRLLHVLSRLNMGEVLLMEVQFQLVFGPIQRVNQEH